MAVYQLTPAPAQMQTVLAASRDLPAGSELSSSSLKSIQVPQNVIPEGSFVTATEVAGRRLAAPLRLGQLLNESAILGPGLLTGAAPGSTAVPVRMADPGSIRLLAPGQLVNIVLSSSEDYGGAKASTTVATSVPVLWTATAGTGSRSASNKSAGGSTGGLGAGVIGGDPNGAAAPWLGADTQADGLIVVAATPEQAKGLAGASTKGGLFFVVVA